MASYGLPAQAKATPRPDPLLFLGGPACRSPGIRSQRASGPLQWLLLGFQRRLPGLKPSKPLKPLKGHFNGFLWASSAGKSPHPWLFMGVQACRLPGLKPSKPLKPLKGHFNGFLWASSAGKSPHPWLFMGVQACRLPALKGFTLQTPKTPKRPLQWLLMGFQRRQKPTSMAFYGRPSLPFARVKTLQTA